MKPPSVILRGRSPSVWSASESGANTVMLALTQLKTVKRQQEEPTQKASCLIEKDLG